MATNTGKKNIKKKGNIKNTKTIKSKTQASQNEAKFLKEEIVLLCIFAVSIILCISNFGVGGVIGSAISSFFFGLIGFSAYLFPILLFALTAFYIANKSNTMILRKLIGSVAFFLFFTAFTQLLMLGYSPENKISECFKISVELKLGGGVIGGTIAILFAKAFGKIGSYVLVIIGMIIAAIIVTQKPLLKQLRFSGNKIFGNFSKSFEQFTKGIKINFRRKKHSRSNLSIEDINQTFFEDTNLLAQVEEDTEQQKIKRILEAPLGTTNLEEKKKAEKKREDFLVNLERRQKAKESKQKLKEDDDKTENLANNVRERKTKTFSNPSTSYKTPPLALLTKGGKTSGDSTAHLRETAQKLQKTLKDFGVNVTVSNASCGPTVTRYELQPEQGVKVSRITGLADDIKLNLAAADIRIEAPIPGKAAVGIEVPNEHNSTVYLRELLQSEEFEKSSSLLSFAAGKDIAGKPVITDIAKMPHLLIAGATGSGKSVCINTLIMSILYKASPEDVKLIMIDPKMVELSVYNGIPHLYIPVVTDAKKAAGALNWSVAQMNDRYKQFSELGVRDLESYNKKVMSMENTTYVKLPQMVIIVDELADLMMVAPGEVEDSICRLAQLARAAGIHLILATQRPSVNVITGLIKANMPSRIAFSVSSGVDSRTILDMNGAEKLLGKGDMLFYPQGYPKPVRVQGAFVSDSEIQAVVAFVSKQKCIYNEKAIHEIEESAKSGIMEKSGDDIDEYFAEAGRCIIEKDKASIGMLQRVLKIGFNRAARIMDQLYNAKVVGEEEGTKPRKVLMTMEEFENYLKKE